MNAGNEVFYGLWAAKVFVNLSKPDGLKLL